MKIVQRDPALFAPLIAGQELIPVLDEAGTPELRTHLDLEYTYIPAVSGHNDVRLLGVRIDNTESITVKSNPPNLVDYSDFPVIKRANPSVDSANISINNGRGTAANEFVRFTFDEPYPYRGHPITIEPGSYLEYSKARVDALTSAAPNNLWKVGSERVNLGTFPHAAISAVTVIGGYGGPGGFPFTAITPRHAISAGHYGRTLVNMAGQKLYWRTPTNTLVERTIVASRSEYYVATPDSLGLDIAIVVLDSDLPEEIEPVQIAGAWAENHSEIVTNVSFKTAPQNFGITLFGNDGHWAPGFRMSWLPDPRDWFFVAGRIFGRFPQSTHSMFDAVLCSPTWQQKTTRKNWLGNDDVFGVDEIGGKFSHTIRPGDSGSPVFIPIADNKWAFAGMFSAGLFRNPIMNVIIGLVDAELDTPTGYTATEAADPML
jgi:hypothetical protein